MKDLQLAKKLYKLSLDQSGTPEGESAREKLTRILEKNGWKVEALEEVCIVLVEGNSAERDWERTLVQVVSDKVGCEVSEDEGIGLHGDRNVVERGAWLFSYLQVCIDSEADEYNENRYWMSPFHLAQTKGAFCEGSVLGILNRLIDGRRLASSEQKDENSESSTKVEENQESDPGAQDPVDQDAPFDSVGDAMSRMMKSMEDKSSQGWWLEAFTAGYAYGEHMIIPEEPPSYLSQTLEEVATKLLEQSGE